MEPETCDGIKERDSYHRGGGGGGGGDLRGWQLENWYCPRVGR